VVVELDVLLEEEVVREVELLYGLNVDEDDCEPLVPEEGGI
jgi:hypothetical protein